MNLITFRDVIYKGKSLFDCLLKKDMTLDEAFCILEKVITAMASDTNLDDVRIAEIGISPTELSERNLLSAILNELITTDISLNNQIGLITKSVQSIIDNTTHAADEKVKASSKDTAGSSYLIDKLSSEQGAGTIIFDPLTNTVLLKGFVPIGANFTVGKERIGDFDGTGKGKAGTDLWGYAIRNGKNGTDNALDRMPRYVDTLNSAGNTGGANESSIAAEHIPSLDVAIAGSIDEALVEPVQFNFKLEANKLADGAGGSVFLLRVGDGQAGTNDIKTIAKSLKHAHGHSLSGKFENIAQKGLPVLPKYIMEIPIKRIAI